MHTSITTRRTRRAIGPEFRSSFHELLAAEGCDQLRRSTVTTLQMNLGRVCNQACSHCHVAAGPNESQSMGFPVAEKTMAVISDSSRVATVDVTGGAPELNPCFRYIVATSRSLGRHVIDRTNLTVFLEPGMESIPDFLAKHQAEIVASLPCYTAANVDSQRGRGTFDRCLQVLKRLNSLGYGMLGSPLRLSLVYNPSGEFLPAPQGALEVEYKKNLRELHGIEFHKLLTITNVPIGRFGDTLRVRGKTDSYLSLLATNFNRRTLANVMCRSSVSVAPDGQLFDCDFNQAIGISTGWRKLSLWDIKSLNDLDGSTIATDRHCFACTAGSGSSCGGSLEWAGDGNTM